MPAATMREVGERIAALRRARRMTQRDLSRAAFVSLSMLRKTEQGSRLPSDDTLDAIAAALGTDPTRLLTGQARPDSRVRDALPDLSAAIASFDIPDDGPVRSLPELRAAVDEATRWRLSAQYTSIARHVPALLTELARALQADQHQPDIARLLTAAYRAADAAAYKYGAHDLSARLVELMRWAAAHADDPLLNVTGHLLRICGKDWESVTYVPDRQANDIRYSMDWSKAADRLGFRPRRDFQEGLAETADWYRRNSDRWAPLMRNPHAARPARAPRSPAGR